MAHLVKSVDWNLNAMKEARVLWFEAHCMLLHHYILLFFQILFRSFWSLLSALFHVNWWVLLHCLWRNSPELGSSSNKAQYWEGCADWKDERYEKRHCSALTHISKFLVLAWCLKMSRALYVEYVLPTGIYMYTLSCISSYYSIVSQSRYESIIWQQVDWSAWIYRVRINPSCFNK